MDGEKSFATGELLNFYNQNNIETYTTATGRSEMNGTVERFHSTILEIYRITKAENPTMTLHDLLILSVNKYNNTIHSATKHTPQEIILPSARSPEIIESVYKNLIEKQKIDLKFHNKHRKGKPFKENQEVYEKTRQRVKHKPRYKKVTIDRVNRSTVLTKDGRRIHKDDLKIRQIK